MPRLPDVANVVRLRLIGLRGSLPWNAVQYARFSGANPSATDLQTVGTAVGGAWNAALSQIHGLDVSLTQVEVTDLTRIDAAVGIASMSFTGNRSGGTLSNQVAMVASYKINVRYRGGHPRTYWPAGVPNDVQGGHLWSGTFLTLAQGACTDYVGDINAITLLTGLLTFCAVSFYQGRDPVTGDPILRDVPVTYPVQSVQVHQRVDTQRRRLGKEVA